jgi:hypothetical protein
MTDKFKIEKNIPITPQRHKQNTLADLLNMYRIWRIK